jgi:hypothetical protein
MVSVVECERLPLVEAPVSGMVYGPSGVPEARLPPLPLQEISEGCHGTHAYAGFQNPHSH